MKTIQKKHNGMLLAFSALLLVIALVSLAGWILLKPAPVMLQGQAEANEIRVSGKIPGRIQRFMVEEGSEVSKGDTVAILDSPELQARLTQASSAEEAASAQQMKAAKGSRAEQIAGAYELWQKALAGAGLAEKTLKRVQNMFEEGVIPQQKKDEADAAYSAALATAKAAKAQYDMAINGAEKEDKLAAEAMVNRAKGAVAEVKSYLSETILLAPASGEISDIFPKPGELVGTGAPVMNIVDLEDIYVILNIREDQLTGFTKGKEFTATVPALGGQSVKLKIYYIKPMASYATFKATKTNEGFDVKTFEVRAKPLSKITGLRPGMSILTPLQSAE